MPFLKSMKHKHFKLLKSERILSPEDFLFPEVHQKIQKAHQKSLKKIKIHKK